MGNLAPLATGDSVYLGSYVTEENAARAHDLAALKYWGAGPNTKLNFNVRTVCFFVIFWDLLFFGIKSFYFYTRFLIMRKKSRG
jgi:hypothetical protein